jgi:CBS domain-containing protein
MMITTVRPGRAADRPAGDVENPTSSAETRHERRDHTASDRDPMTITMVHPARVAAIRTGGEASERLAMVHGTPTSTRRPDDRARTAADVMTRSPETVSWTASLWTAWDRLHGTHDQHLVVVDGQHRPVGVLDDRTIGLEWPPGPMGAHRKPVHSLLRDRARPRVRSTDDIESVARTMLGARVDALPVVDRGGRLLGLITLWHLAQMIVDGRWGERPERTTAQPTGVG